MKHPLPAGQHVPPTQSPLLQSELALQSWPLASVVPHLFVV